MRKLSGIILIVVCAFLFRLHSLNKTTIHPDNFSTWNKIEIYTLGWVMSTIAQPLYPETSYEHQLLFEQGPDIIKQGDFFLKSTTVQDAIKLAKVTGHPIRLSWPSSIYNFNPTHYWETRIALALNNARLSLYKDEVQIKVSISYPKNSYAPLIGGVGVEEGLFWILQQAGWYHTKKLTWITEMPQGV
tara:strand:- start:55 stop:618 length:564 start_codon:yes stop_codon:yes gene_type:complete